MQPLPDIDFDAIAPERLPALLRTMPKAELHIHIEGSLELELILQLAQRNGRQLPYADVAALREAYAFTDLQSFLDIYYAGAGVLINEADFFDMAWAYFERAAADNVVHAELFFDPQTHTERGVPFETMITGLEHACRRAHAEFGISAKLILCFLRHLSEEAAFATLEQALPLAPIVATPQADEVASEYIYEPSPQQIFDQLLGRLVEAQLLRSLLESSAAEHAARMTAMDAATRNSADMIEDLTLTMNKVRQAAITREIIEVVSGAQAL
jgi:adenosine deaminase